MSELYKFYDNPDEGITLVRDLWDAWSVQGEKTYTGIISQNANFRIITRHEDKHYAFALFLRDVKKYIDEDHGIIIGDTYELPRALPHKGTNEYLLAVENAAGEAMGTNPLMGWGR